MCKIIVYASKIACSADRRLKHRCRLIPTALCVVRVISVSSAARLFSRAFECSLDTECVPFRFPRVLSPCDRLLSIVGKRVYQAAPRKFVTNCSNSHHRHHHHRRRYIFNKTKRKGDECVSRREDAESAHTFHDSAALEIRVGTICWGRNEC